MLKLYVTSANFAKTPLKIGQLVKLKNKSVVPLADKLRLKAAMRGKAYPNERIKDVFINRPPLFICSDGRMFSGSELDAHLTELAQYADTLLDQ